MFKFNFDLDEDLDSISGDSSKQTEENVHKPARENESPIDRPSMLEIHLETLVSLFSLGITPEYVILMVS